LRILCAREFQRSIAQSVHQLLSDQIRELGLEDRFEVEKARIAGRNGSEFTFAGLRHNIDSIKSIEGSDVCWVEEAQTCSQATWEKLIPTIRKDGSEIVVTFNPELETDETYRRMVLNPPPGAWVQKITWRDNPWFPDVLRAEMQHCRETDPDAFLTIWEGNCRQALTGAIFAREIRAATEEGRIRSVPYDQTKPVDTFWDLGRRDFTAIWFVQKVGFEYRVLDFVQDRGHALSHYIKALKDKPYAYGRHWLPHDAENELLASERTIAQQMRAAFPGAVQAVPKISVQNGNNAAREIFGACWFDEAKCADGLNALRRYCYDVDPDTGQWSVNPKHDDASHGADAFRYFAVAMREKPKPTAIPKVRFMPAGAGGWMG